jgi:hypothetical protein
LLVKLTLSNSPAISNLKTKKCTLKQYTLLLTLRLLGGVIKNIKDYCFQYVGLVINNKKYIYINAFQIESAHDLDSFYKDWKTSPVIVCDGGDSFWGVLYDLETGLFTKLSINGAA